MKIVMTFVGHLGYKLDNIELPEGSPVPREGESVEIPQVGSMFVRTVVWYPVGSDSRPEPFVYVIVGDKARPDW